MEIAGIVPRRWAATMVSQETHMVLPPSDCMEQYPEKWQIPPCEGSKIAKVQSLSWAQADWHVSEVKVPLCCVSREA